MSDAFMRGLEPEALRWHVWFRGADRAGGRYAKVPASARTGRAIDPTREFHELTTLYEALDACERYHFSGVGRVLLPSDTLVFIDLDFVRNPLTGEIYSHASELVRYFNSYTEISPSGTGLHIFVRGNLPEGCPPNLWAPWKAEVYSCKRFAAMTGAILPGLPDYVVDRQAELNAWYEAALALDRGQAGGERRHRSLWASEGHRVAPADVLARSLPLTDAEVLKKCHRARNSSEFQLLWDGAWVGHYPSQSEADLALCSFLAYHNYIVVDDASRAAQIDRLLRRSGLMRPKWERPSYSDRTISVAIDTTTRNATKTRRVACP